MAAPDRPPRRDRKPERAGEPVEIRDPRQAQRRPLRRRLIAAAAASGRRPASGEIRPLTKLFGFVQFDFAGALPLADGRYLARDPGPPEEESVLVLRQTEAPAARARRRRNRAVQANADAAAVTVTRVTAIRAFAPFEGEEDAARWLDEACEAEDTVEVLVDEGLALLNRALHAQAVASGNPSSRSELAAEGAERVLVGYGSGEETADGRFTEAREAGLAPRRSSRRRRREEELRPQERVAAVLRGRESLDACETLLLRARADLDAGRPREAALQLRVGLEALLVELKGVLADPGHEEDMATLHSRRAEAGDAANAALRGDLSPAQLANVQALLEIGERVLRRRRVLRG